MPVDVLRPEEMRFGAVKQAFLGHHAAQFLDQGTPVEYDNCCFWNQDSFPIPDRAPIAAYCWEHNDFYLRDLPASEQEAAGALAASREKRGELSYYYAHDRQAKQPALVSRPQAGETFRPAAREPVRSAAPAAGATRFNAKQSPFGTNVNAYETITTYTWEDHDDNTVKVLVPLDGVGKLPAAAVRSNFGLRCFELLIDGYDGKNLRFACAKTHAEMKPDECKHVVRANRVNLVIKKGKEKDIWFDLFKKRAIGDDDDP